MNYFSGDHGERLQSDRLQSTNDRRDLVPVAVKTVATLFDLWALPPRKAAKLLNVDDGAWTAMDDGRRKGILSAEQLGRASAFVTVYRSVAQAYGEKDGESWPMENNRLDLFYGKPPVDFMAAGGLDRIMAVRRHLSMVRDAAAV